VQQPCAHHERVGGDHVDEARARAVRALGHCDEQLPMLRLALDDERVASLDAEGRTHDRVGVALERLGRQQRFAHHR
jgi:hypothetical protein